MTPGHQDLTLHALRGVLDRFKHQDTIRWLRKQFRIDDRGRLAAHPRPGLARTGLAGYLVATAYNLVCMVNLTSGLGTAAGPPDPAEGSRAHRTTYTPIPRTIVVADGIQNLFFRSLLG